MKRGIVLLAATVIGAACLVFAAATPPSPAMNPASRFQYNLAPTFWEAENYGNRRDTARTWHSIINKSPNNVKLGPVIVAGPKGALGPLTVWNGLQGKDLPAFGTERFELKDIPGVQPWPWRQQATTGHRLIVVTWTGPVDAVRLSTTTYTYFPGAGREGGGSVPEIR